jgi:hypothetical protein
MADGNAELQARGRAAFLAEVALVGLVPEASIAGITPVAAGAAPAPPPAEKPRPQTMGLEAGARVRLRRTKRTAPLAESIGGTVGEVVSAYERNGIARLDVEFLGAKFGCMFRALTNEDVEELPRLGEDGALSPEAEKWAAEHEEDYRARYGKNHRPYLRGAAVAATRKEGEGHRVNGGTKYVGEDAAALREAHPDAEGWVGANKAGFKERHGEGWKKALYGRAWKMFGKDAVNKGLGENHVEVVAEEYMGSEGGEGPVPGPAITVSVSGSVGSGKSAVLAQIASKLARAGMTAVYHSPDEQTDAEMTDGSELRGKKVVLKAVYEKPEEQLDEAGGASGGWKGRRSLTAAEAAKLKVPKGELECSVGYVPERGYVCWTHRARSGFFPAPDRIPAKTLKFIGSTG